MKQTHRTIAITKLAADIAVVFGFTLNDLQGKLRYAYLQQLRQGTALILDSFDFDRKDIAIAMNRELSMVSRFVLQAKETIKGDHEFAKLIDKASGMIAKKVTQPTNHHEKRK